MTIDKVKEMLANQLNVEVDKINEGSKIIEDLGADSLDMIEMLMALEEEFNINKHLHFNFKEMVFKCRLFFICFVLK